MHNIAMLSEQTRSWKEAISPFESIKIVVTLYRHLNEHFQEFCIENWG